MMRPIAFFLVLVGAAIPSTAATADRTAPAVTFGTANGSVLISNPQGGRSDMAPIEVAGTVRDSASGVRRVYTTWSPCSSSTCTAKLEATPLHAGGTPALACSSPTQRSCTWRASTPGAPGWYRVSAWARDFAGNRSSARSISVLVL